MTTKGSLGSLSSNHPDSGSDFLSSTCYCEACKENINESDMHDEDMCQDCFTDLTSYECQECGKFYGAGVLNLPESEWKCNNCKATEVKE